MPPLVLDTHVLVWLVDDDRRLLPGAATRVERAAAAGAVHVPAIAIWEIGMLESKERLTLTMPIGEWVARALALPGVQLEPLTPDIALDASRLPGRFHGDPADRIIVATARRLQGVLMTADRSIQAYGAAGHLSVTRAA